MAQVTSPSKRRQKAAHNLHWRVPTVMVSAFVSGLVAAVGHHVLYSQINGRIVKSDVEQQVVTSAGTAFAFLVKVLLAVSSGTAFIQCLWVVVGSKPVAIKNMDSMFDILSNSWEYLNFKFWARHPMLTVTSAITWLIPLSAVFSPGTISVVPRLRDSLELFQVPQRNFTALDNTISRNDNGDYEYEGGSSFLINVAGLNLYTGNLLDFHAGSEGQNLTFNLEFYGPTVRCTRANASVVSLVLPAAAEYMNQSQQGLYFSSWIPDYRFSPDINGSFFDDIINNFDRGQTVLDNVSTDATKIYQTLAFFNGSQTLMQNSNDILQHVQVIECGLHNASYHVQVALKSDGQQKVDAYRTLLGGLPARDTLPGTTLVETAVEWFNAQAIMEIFAFYAAVGSVTYDLNSTRLAEHDNANLAANPYLARAILPDSYGTITYDEYILMLEEFFQNITLSWRFGQPPFSSYEDTVGNNYGPDAQVTATLSQSLNTFVYRPRALYIAYGLAIFSTLVCLVLGLFATYRNGFCYSNSFSSIVRMTRDPAFAELIDADADLDSNGADPIPEELGNTQIVYVNGRRYEELREVGRGAGRKVVGRV